MFKFIQIVCCRGIEALCLELDKIRTSGSTIISTFRHQCDSGRQKRVETDENYLKHLELPTKLNVQQKFSEGENFTKETLPIPKYSFIDKPTLIKDTDQDILLSGKISSPRNLSISPQTTQVLENVEALIKNAEKQLNEIRDNISFYMSNLEMPDVQPTIDEDLLRLRQMVALKFHEVNNPSKVQIHKQFSSSIPQVPEENTIKAPRLLKLMTMFPEKFNSIINDDNCCRNTSQCSKSKNPPNSHMSHTCDQIKTESHQEKAAQTDETENKTESSIFQIQNGPKVIINRSLQIQNVDNFHVSPETSYQKPNNVGIYNFRYKAPSEQSELSEEKFSDDDDNQISKKETSRTKKTVKRAILKIADNSKKRAVLKKNSEMGKFTNTDNLSEINIDSGENVIDGELSRALSSKISTKDIENAKTKFYSQFSNSPEKDSSGPEKDFNHPVINPKPEKLQKDDENRQIPSSRSVNLAKNKPKIISSEKVNFQYKEILKGAGTGSRVPNPSTVKFDKLANEPNPIDHINLEKISVFDLDTAIRRNNEVIDSVIQNTDVFLKTLSPKFQFQNDKIDGNDININIDNNIDNNNIDNNIDNNNIDNNIDNNNINNNNFNNNSNDNQKNCNNDNNEENQKIDRNAEMVQNFKSPLQQLESIKTALLENFPNKYFPEKENELMPVVARRVDSIPNKFSKFSPKSEINNQESATNSQSINLSSISLSLMSSTKNMIFQPSLPSTVAKSSSKEASKDETLNDLKDLSIEIFSDKKETSIVQLRKNSEEEKFNSTDDDFNRRKSEKFPPKLKEAANIEKSGSDANKMSAKISLKSGDFREEGNGNKFSQMEKSGTGTNKISPKISLRSNNFEEETNRTKSKETEIFHDIFKLLKNSTEAMKKLLTCLCGEAEARIENEIINILRELGVNATIINQFLLILQNRDKNSRLLTFIEELRSHLAPRDIESETKRHFLQFSDKSQKSSLEISREIENKDNKSRQTKSDFDVSAKDKNVIYSDCKSVVTGEKNDLLTTPEVNIFDKLDRDFSRQQLAEADEIFVDKNDKIQEQKKAANDEQKINNSTDLQTEPFNANGAKSNDLLEIKSKFNSEKSAIGSSGEINYSQNFTESLATRKYCKSLESHVSLRLSDSFMNKEDSINKEISAEQNVELDIQQKLNNLLDMETQVARSIEESLKTEINNLSKEKDFQSGLKRKSLIRGETFIIKKSNLDHKEKGTQAVCSDSDNSLNKSQGGSQLKTPSVISVKSRKIDELSSETYSEGEINWPSSCSYSLGEVRGSQGMNIGLEKNVNKFDSNTSIRSKKHSSSSSTILSNSTTRSLGEIH